MLISNKAKRRAKSYLRKTNHVMIPDSIVEDARFFAVNVHLELSPGAFRDPGGLTVLIVDTRDDRVFEFCVPHDVTSALDLQRYRSLMEDALREAFPSYEMCGCYAVVITRVAPRVHGRTKHS